MDSIPLRAHPSQCHPQFQTPCILQLVEVVADTIMEVAVVLVD
jgi:hypothetical protein